MISTDASTLTTIGSPTPRRPTGRTLVLAALSSLLLAAPLAAFEIESYVIAPGGGAANQGGWDLHATLGQPVAGTSQGGAFELRAGFWSAEFPVEPPADAIFSDRFEDTTDALFKTNEHRHPDTADRSEPGDI